MSGSAAMSVPAVANAPYKTSILLSLELDEPDSAFAHIVTRTPLQLVLQLATPPDQGQTTTYFRLQTETMDHTPGETWSSATNKCVQYHNVISSLPTP